jgi:nucleotide-binding universal stress UspA family protein
MPTFKVLVPIIGRRVPAAWARQLIATACNLVGDDAGTATVLSVVEIPEDRSLSEGALLAQRQRQLLRRWGGVIAERVKMRTVVRMNRDLVGGVQEAVREEGCNLLLLGWRGPIRSEERLARSALDQLVLDPPCDIAVLITRPWRAIKEGHRYEVPRSKEPEPAISRASIEDGERSIEPARKQLENILVPVRGGPHAALALRIAQQLARCCGATVTVIHITRPQASEEDRQRDERFQQELRAAVAYEHTRYIKVTAPSIEEAIIQEAKQHDLIVLGAAARGWRSTHLFGPIPERIADRVPCTVMIVKTATPVTPSMFGVKEPTSQRAPTLKDSVSTAVDRWFAENTFHSHEFANLHELMRLKERQGLSISLALPALNEERTIGKIIRTIKSYLIDRIPLLDEIVLIDSGSEDRTVQIASEFGIPIFNHADILPQYGSYRGKGEALWKSLHVTRGDIVVWLDSDITDIHPKFVYGLVGPLLTQPHVQFVKGFYRRPLNLGGTLLTTGGGRVTELTARPLINLFYPQLSGLVQPLAGEMAGRRAILERVAFFTGYGVETGLLIDILEQFGINAIAQSDLENRIHRNQSLLSLSKMAFAIVQVVMKRLEQRQHIRLLDEMNTSMKLIHYSPSELFLEVKEIQEHERPPMSTIPEYNEHQRRNAGLDTVEHDVQRIEGTRVPIP